MSSQLEDAKKRRNMQQPLGINKSDDDYYQKSIADFNKAIDNLREAKRKEKLYVAKIKMMLNPWEEQHIKLVSYFNRVSLIYNSLTEAGPEIFANKNSDANKLIDGMIECSQVILKQEWIRVKSGL